MGSVKRITDHIRDRIEPREPIRYPDLEALKMTEWSPDFERLRLNRLILGAMRYGRLGASGKPQWDRVPDMIRRLRMYAEDRNAEHLVDVANLAMLEYVEGTHNGVQPKDDGAHTETAGGNQQAEI